MLKPVEIKALPNYHVGPLGNIAWTDKVDICPDALYLEILERVPKKCFRGYFDEAIDER